MNKIIDLSLSPEEAFSDTLSFNQKLNLSETDWYIRPLKRSIDARSRNIVVHLQVEAIRKPFTPVLPSFRYDDVSRNAEVIVVGSGPAGLFAALRLIELGFRPIVLERGKDVRARRRDLAAINKENIVNPESNYCFGEGGAGTYSDGKLYTRSKKRGNVLRILQIMVANGATEEILYDAHPHIGTNNLPKLVAALRERIIAVGGVVRFDSKVTDFIIESNECRGVTLADGTAWRGVSVILATGHSARDIFHILDKKKILIEAKAFALGVRIEHHQNLIDKIQYHCAVDRGPVLPAAGYALVHQARVDGRDRGVFTFCMCPGGFIVPAATSPGEVVVNGMSPSRRDSKYANSGIVVAVDPADFRSYEKYGPLAGMYFQSDIERKACEIAGGTQVAPAQRMIDFTQKKRSADLPDTSYQPGIVATELGSVLPDFIAESLRQGLVNFGSRMKGYLTNEAQLLGVESRTSSPVRIPRDDKSLEHPQIARLFPCGEGAGYAGGIVSAAIDGERCAEAIAIKYAQKIK